MNPEDKIAGKLTKEIITYFNLPTRICSPFIKQRILWGIAYGHEMGRLSGYKGRGKPVLQYTIGGTLVKRYESLKAASEAVHCHLSMIHKVVNGEKHSAKGFLWKYA